jgi:hypothetical protein
MRSIIIAARSSTPKTIPAIAAERRVRQKPAVRCGAPSVIAAPLELRRRKSADHEVDRASSHLWWLGWLDLRYCLAMATRSRSSGSMKWS